MAASSVKNLLFIALSLLVASLLAGWTLSQDVKEDQPPSVVAGLTDSQDILLLTGLMENRGLDYSFFQGEVRAKEWQPARYDLRVRMFWSDSGRCEMEEMAGKVEVRIREQAMRLIDRVYSPEWPLAVSIRVQLEVNPDFTPPSRVSDQLSDFPCDPTGGSMRGQFPYRIAQLNLLLLSDERNLASGGREELFKVVKMATSFKESRGDTLTVIDVPSSDRWNSVYAWTKAYEQQHAGQIPSFDYRKARRRLEQTRVKLDLQILDGNEIWIELRNSSRTPWRFYDDSLKEGSEDEPRFIWLEWRKDGLPIDGFMSCHSNSLLDLPVTLSTLEPGESLSRRVKVHDLLPGLGPQPDDSELEFKAHATVYFDPNLWTYIESETDWHRFKKASRTPK